MADMEERRKISLPPPKAELKAAVKRLFHDALNFEHPAIAILKGTTPAEKAATLRAWLHLSDISNWNSGASKVDHARKGQRGEVRHLALAFANRLIGLLSGTIYFDHNNDESELDNRAFARDLLAYWTSGGTKESVADILDGVKSHREELRDAINRLDEEKAEAGRTALALAAAAARSANPSGSPEPGFRPSEGVALLPDRAVAGTPSPDEAEIANGHAMSVIRLCATPPGTPLPRPVNLLMTLGVSRTPAIAVVTGLEAVGLFEGLVAVETMLSRLDGRPFAPRGWTHGPPASSMPIGGARGAVWEMTSCPTAESVWRAVAMTFAAASDQACGGMLVLVLPPGQEDQAQGLVDMVRQGVAASSFSRVGDLPIHLWRAGAVEPAATGSILARIEHCVEAGGCDDPATDVQMVFRMRLHGGNTLSADWDKADAEQIRLHHLALLSSPAANRPDALDEARAIDLVARIERNRALLNALRFLPVSQPILAAIAGASPFTRAVAGLLSPAELRSSRLPWRSPRVQGYRPAPLHDTPIPMSIDTPSPASAAR
jgi:hypothetical protein